MLEEAWHWLRIASTSSARKLGYRREAAALSVRHRRCATAWRPHIEATRAALLESARQAQIPDAAPGSRGRGLLLGGGLPRDVPWRDLLGIFDEVILADVCFHAEARAAQRESRGRVKLMYSDVTGMLEELASHPERIPATDDTTPSPFRELCDGVSWVASVNLLTQIPLLPCAWLRRQGHPEAVLEEFATRLSRRHLEHLAECAGSVCLVAETADYVLDADGALVESNPHTLVTSLQDSRTGWTTLGNWRWQINPPGELQDRMTEQRELAALHRSAAGAGRAAFDNVPASLL